MKEVENVGAYGRLPTGHMGREDFVKSSGLDVEGWVEIGWQR